MVFVDPILVSFHQIVLMELRIAEGFENLKASIAGWVQMNSRDAISLEENVKLEKYYLQNKYYLFDLKMYS